MESEYRPHIPEHNQHIDKDWTVYEGSAGSLTLTNNDIDSVTEWDEVGQYLRNTRTAALQKAGYPTVDIERNPDGSGRDLLILLDSSDEGVKWHLFWLKPNSQFAQRLQEVRQSLRERNI